MLAGTPWRGENRVSPLPGAEEKDGPQTVTITPGAQGAHGHSQQGGPHWEMLPSWSPSPPEPRCTPGHSQQEGPHWFGSWAPSPCREQFGRGAGRCSPDALPPSGLRLPGQRQQAPGSQHAGEWRAAPARVAKAHRPSQIRAASLLPGPLCAFWKWSRQQTGPLGLSALLVLTGPPRLARHSEACPGRGRGGILLGADVERSHQPHKSRALFCLKPPKAPAASPGRPRPRGPPWAAWCGPQPLQPCPAAPPPPHPTARNSVKSTADPGLSQSRMSHRGLCVNYLL